MKILRLQSQNVMRLAAIDITPSGDLVIVGGKNGAGKSSVLNSIAMALGGGALVPEEPIRTGEAEASISIDLGELKVTRKFSRSRLPCDCERNNLRLDAEKLPAHHPTCAHLTKWSDTSSTLAVTNADGTAKYSSPQAMLDALIGKIAFDPLAFASDKDAKRQAETLRRLVGLDTTKVDDRRRAAVARRAVLKRQHDDKVAQAAAMPWHKDAPEEPTSMTAISDEMLKAEQLRAEAEREERAVSTAQDAVTALDGRVLRIAEQIKEAKRFLQLLEDEQSTRNAALLEVRAAIDSKNAAAAAARAAVPDSQVIRAKLAEAEAINAKVRDNAARSAVEQEVDRLSREHDVEQEEVVKCDEEKAAMLRAAKFPVEGLGVNDDGVTFNNLPFSQAATSEQLRASVAVGIALNPKVKVLLVRNGNMLDEDSLKMVGDMAAAASAQVWVEWVTSKSEGVSVMIEDGHVAKETA